MMMQLSEREVVLVIGCDCDPLGFVELSKKSQPRDWEMTVRVLRALVARLSVVPHEESIKVTFLIRSDSCIAETFGEYAYCAKVSHDFLDELRSEGHEIGWHPHLWRWTGKWAAELEDGEYMKQCFVKGFDSLCDYFRVRSVRTGWDFMSNEIMQILESLGLRTDFSALPGIKYQEGEHGIRCDWIGAPTTFYFPSRKDYRRPAVEACFNVLEMPITLTKTPRPVRWFHLFADRCRKAQRWGTPYEAMNFAKHPIFNWNGFDRVFTEDEHTKYVLSYFHPSDVASAGIFSIEYLENNIKYLLTRCREQKRQLITMTATEAAEHYLGVHR